MKVEFLSPLDVRKRSGRDWQLLAPMVFAVDGQKFGVPADFFTDFASVPRLPLAFLLAGDVGHRAATLHDYLYSGRSASPFKREEADRIFTAALEREGVGTFTRGIMYSGVRLGGAGRFTERK